MKTKELYIVCQIEDFELKVMANKYVNNQICVLFKEKITNQQFAENGFIINPTVVAELLRQIIAKINKTLNVNVLRVSLSLPSTNLKIYQSHAQISFKDENHKISSNDINQLIETSKNIAISDDEIICLTKPCTFKVDNNNFAQYIPLNYYGKNLAIESLIYTIPKQIYYSQIDILKLAGLELLSITLDQFALVFNFDLYQNMPHDNNLILIDWGFNETKISVFLNSALYALNNIKLGYNQIIENLMKKMHCSYTKADQYLTKIININSNYLSDVIVDKYFDLKSNQTINLTKLELQTTACQVVSEIFQYITYFIKDIVAKNPNIKIIFSGKVTKLPGFLNYTKETYHWKNMMIMLDNIPGIDNFEWSTLIGTTNYQHNLNLYNKILLTSVGKRPELFNTNSEKIKKTKNIALHSHLQRNYQYNIK